MVGRQEQDELGNLMALKYFWFPVLISGARISLYQTSLGGGGEVTLPSRWSVVARVGTRPGV